jgi:MYXO-CTERM domain-containing protein
LCTYPDATVVCTQGSCTNRVATTASVCNSKGSCTPTNQNGCGAYTCGATGCNTSCSGAAQCAVGAWCQNGACVPFLGPDGGVGGSTGSGGGPAAGGVSGAGATPGAGGAAGAGGTTGAGAAGVGGSPGTAATSGASGSASPDAGESTGGSGATFAEPFAPQDPGCGCRTARSADDRTGSLLAAIGLGLSLVRRRKRDAPCDRRV